MRRTHIPIGFSLCLLGLLALGLSTVAYLEIGASEKVAPSVVQGLADAPIGLILQCIYFLAGFAALHFACGFLLSWLALPLAAKVTKSLKEARKLTWLTVLIFIFTVVLGNKLYFPGTIMSFTTPALLEGREAILVVILSIGLLTWLAAGFFLRLIDALEFVRNSKHETRATAGGILLLTCLGLAHAGLTSREFPQDENRPHVIVVGIDSWRPGTVPAYGGPADLMPFVGEFLSKSVVFEEAITPLARSFPSWWTILDGRYPHEHGVRFNLAPTSQADKPLRLPARMGELGYHRMFAMDERRFAPIDTEHGFDEVVGPSTGAGDFLLGTLNDTPLANFFINTRLGKWLFPFSHGNRAVATTYLPESFDEMLTDAVRSAPRKPLFLTVHYELPHWPYTWAHGPTGLYEHLEGGRSYTRYLETLNQVDKQIAGLFNELDSLGILDNSLIVFLADHGEAFAFDPSVRQALIVNDTRSDQPSPTEPGETSTMMYPGHGTHIFSITQHQVPLAFRDMRNHAIPAGMRSGRASLIDIAPSLLSWLGQDIDQFPGLDLTAHLTQPESRVPDRMIPLETGFSPPSVISGNPDQSRLVAESAAYYRVTSDGSLELREASEQELLRRKQIGLLYADWIVSNLDSSTENLTFHDLSQNRRVTLSTLAVAHKKHEFHLQIACKYIQNQRQKQFASCSSFSTPHALD